MTVNKFLFQLSLLLWLPCSLAAHIDCTAQIAAMRQESSAALNTLLEREQIATQGKPSRNEGILSIMLAAERKLDARQIKHLSAHVQELPDDQFAKIYEGYAWVFSAGEYNRRKNYLRAAEDVKRGFFLIDEAVDSDPENWRLRYLRLRMDAFVPKDLGRYVIAFKDAAILAEAVESLSSDIKPLIFALWATALERSGKLPAAQNEFTTIRARFEHSKLLSQCGPQDFFTKDEINQVLLYALEHKQ